MAREWSSTWEKTRWGGAGGGVETFILHQQPFWEVKSIKVVKWTQNNSGGWSAPLECVQQNVNREEVISMMIMQNQKLETISFVLRILKEGRQYDDLTEVAKLFNIHATE